MSSLAWLPMLRRASITGSIASLVSSSIISWRSADESVAAATGTNATSHWLWGEIAKHQHGISGRYTGIGYAIHHASAVFWALFYERFFPSTRADTLKTVAGAATMAVVAAGADYVLAPQRLRPGFERHLSVPSMVLVYAGFGLGLAAGRYLCNRRR